MSFDELEELTNSANTQRLLKRIKAHNNSIANEANPEKQGELRAKVRDLEQELQKERCRGLHLQLEQREINKQVNAAGGPPPRPTPPEVCKKMKKKKKKKQKVVAGNEAADYSLCKSHVQNNQNLILGLYNVYQSYSQ
ncbi:hypothetical protein QOT17_022857 [Balamuthia mandrillaris]